MSEKYRTIYHSFFKEHVQSITRGEYWLSEESGIDLGEPVVLHPTTTGFVSTPKKKRVIKAYDNATAGAEHAIGISLDIRHLSSGVSSDDIIMRPAWYFPREIAVMKMGICKIINVGATGTTAAAIDEIALPADGGATALSLAGVQSGSGYVLGKWLEETKGQEAGLVYVDPKAEVLP